MKKYITAGPNRSLEPRTFDGKTRILTKKSDQSEFLFQWADLHVQDCEG